MAETADGVQPKKANEFMCTGCFLLVNAAPVRPARPPDVPGRRERLPGHQAGREAVPKGTEVASAHAVRSQDWTDHHRERPRRVEEPARPVFDVFVYAPLGFALDARQLCPKFVDRGRNQVVLARVVGKYAVRKGIERPRVA